MTEVLHGPQPLGAFGFPAGFLLVPMGGAEVEAARAELVAGRLPSPWPPALEGHRLVHEDRLDGAAQAFAGGTALDAYHRWLLDPGACDADAVRAGLPPAYAPLVDLVLHSAGLAPAPGGCPAEAAPEVAALVAAARATSLLDDGDPQPAVDGLLAAAGLVRESLPVTAAVLEANAALLVQEAGGDGTARMRGALEALDGTSLADVRAELRLRLGSVAQERAASGAQDPRAGLQEAMGHYYEGLRLVTEESAPHLWAALTMNLATAQLTVPMSTASDQLRLGVATQALRACRRVLTLESAPVQWATATLNLANALVYTPSTHQGDNLVEAVELYEEVIASGVREHDPLGRARLLANQGNVLAHLGAFDVARPKLVEARYLFEQHLDHDGAATVRAILGEIAKAHVEDPDDELADLARQAEQMSRMPQPEGAFTSGMGVTVTAGGEALPDLAPAPRPTVTVLDPASRPTPLPGEAS